MNMANKFFDIIKDAFWSPDNIESEATELSCDSSEDIKTVEELNKTLKSVDSKAKEIEQRKNEKTAHKKEERKTYTAKFDEELRDEIINLSSVDSGKAWNEKSDFERF